MNTLPNLHTWQASAGVSAGRRVSDARRASFRRAEEVGQAILEVNGIRNSKRMLEEFRVTGSLGIGSFLKVSFQLNNLL